MRGMNKVIIVGNVGKDPELRHTQSGNSVCNFNVATSESYLDKNGVKQEKTEWHKIQAWGKLSEICTSFAKKGSKILVEGKLQTNSWEDKNGKKNYSTEIVASNVVFLGDKSKPNENEHWKKEEDDLPF